MFCSAARRCRGVWGRRIPLEYTHPTDALLGYNPVNGQAKVMSGLCGTPETPNTCKMWSGIVMLKHPNVQVHVRNDVILQDFVSLYLMPVNTPATCRLQEAFYHHNGFLPTSWHCLPETGRLIARMWSITYPTTSIDVCTSISTRREKTRLIWE